MSASEDKEASQGGQINNQGHAEDHGHNEAVAFVPDDSWHDRVLSFLAIVVCFCVIALLIYWAGLPLAGDETAAKPEPAPAASAIKTAP